MLTTLPLDSIIGDLFFKGAHYFLFLGDLACGSFRWSENAVTPLRLSGTETSGAVWEDLLLPEDATILREALSELGSGQRGQFQREFPLRISGGMTTARFQLWSLAEQGEPMQCAGIITDLEEMEGLDSITGLQGSGELRRLLEGMVASKTVCGLLLLSPDTLRRIHESHNQSLGDAMLRTLATRMEALLPADTSLFHLDGDSFALLLPGATPESVLAQFSRFQELTLQPLPVGESTVPFTLSGGACFFPKDGSTVDSLLSSARFALGVSRANGGNQFVLFTQELSDRTRREQLLTEKLRESVSRGFIGFSLNYQPLILAENSGLYGCEVLLRWHHTAFPEGVSPFEFIPLLERSGLMPKVGAWVIGEALHQCAKWVKFMPKFQMSINVTYEQFQDPEFRFFVMDCLCREKLNPGLLTLELTESNCITETETIRQAFDFFRSQGIKMAFDDFGMGYASLDIFRLLSADELKIDRSFLDRLTYDVTDQKIIAHLISLCDSINMNVCVEGVETREVMNIVQQLKPMLLQGYYYNKPLTAQAFEEYYFTHHSAPVSGESAHQAEPAPSPLRPAQPASAETLVDCVNAGIFQVCLDHDFTFLACNEGYRKMLGYTAKEMEQKFQNRSLRFVHPDDMAHIREEVRRQLGMGDTISITFRVVRSDGLPLWVYGSGSVIRGKSGSSSLAVVVLDQDQTYKKALKMEEDYHQYKHILTNLPSGVKCIRFDEVFTLDYISPALLSLLGYNESDIASKFRNQYINMIYEEDRSKVFSDLFEQVKDSSIITLRYRVPRKDGSLIWLETVTRLCPPSEDGIQRCYACVVGVSDQLTDESPDHAGRLASRYQRAATQWGDVLFECDFRTNAMTYSDNFAAIFGRPASSNTSAMLEMVHPDDRPLVMHTMQELRLGRRSPPMEIRALFGDGSYRWCAINFNEADMLGGVAISAVGKVRDIDQERHARERLLAQVQLDPLTNLLNKRTLEERVRLVLTADQPEHHSALFMMDVDNFKQINDHHGHPCGDHILGEVAERLRNLFSAETLLGRVGGDEFMAFMRLTDDEPTAEEQCQRMMAAMEFPFLFGDKEIDVTFSVGVSLYPEDGQQFFALFRRADAALYRAKELGKNCFCLTTG